MNGYSVQQLKKIKSHINNGGIFAYPTEHCYGIGCHYKNINAIRKIIRLKHRNSSKGMILISGNIKHFKEIININECYKEYWPGPFTLLFESKNKYIQKIVSGNHNKVAIRVSKHKLVSQLCNYLNHPVVSTSANYSNRFPAKSYKECIRIFGKKLMIIPGLTNFNTKPSRIIDYETKEILR